MGSGQEDRSNEKKYIPEINRELWWKVYKGKFKGENLTNLERKDAKGKYFESVCV